MADNNSGGDSSSPPSSSSLNKQSKKQKQQRAQLADQEAGRSLLDGADDSGDSGDSKPHSSSNVSGLVLALGGAASVAPARQPTPASSPNAPDVPFAQLSGGEDEERRQQERARSSSSSSSSNMTAAAIIVPSPSRRRHGSDNVDTHHPLPAASPPAFLQLPSSPSHASPRLDASGATTESAGDLWSRQVIWRQRVRELLSWATWRYYVSHAWREMKKRKFNYCLGLFSCFLVVCVAGVCYTLIARAPVVFLQQAETNGSQMDLALTPSGSFGAPFFNYSTLTRNAAISSDFSLHSARTEMSVRVYPAAACPQTLDPFAVDWKYVGLADGSSRQSCQNNSLTCLEPLCANLTRYALDTEVPFTSINTDREKRMGLGRMWPYEPIPSGSVLITQDLSNLWGILPGDVIQLKFAVREDLNNHFDDGYVHTIGHILQAAISKGMQATLAAAGARFDGNTTTVLSAALQWYSRAVYAPFVVQAVIPKSYAKFVSDTNAHVIAESGPLLQYLMQYVHPVLRTQTSVDGLAQLMRPFQRFFPGLDSASASDSRLRSIPRPLVSYGATDLSPDPAIAALGFDHVDSYSTLVAFNIPDRVDVYLSTNYDEIAERVIGWSSALLYAVGFTEANSELPILREIATTQLFSLYLGLILSVILTILFLLSLLLIYSLLMISIESRTFELGVHRMCGMNRFNIVKLLLVQALSFSIPAWAIGLTVSQIIIAAVVSNLSASVEVPLSLLLTPRAIGVASIMGLLIPLLASVLPIRQALGHNLQDALDTRHSKTIGVKYSIERSEDSELDYAWLALGVGMAVIGFSIYFLMPLALLSFNLTLLINIFFALLLGMLLGLILLSLNIQPVLERIIVFLLLWWEKAALSGLVLKNLLSHRVRNRKTSIMFALSIAFVLFIVTQFQLEMYSAKARSYRYYGAELVLYPSGGSTWNALDPSGVAPIESLLAAYPSVVSTHGWVSSRLSLRGEWDDTAVSNVGHAFSNGVDVWGVSSTAFEATLNEYLVYDADTPRDSGASLSEQSFSARGSQAAMMGSNAKQMYGLSSTRHSFLLALQKRATELTDASLAFHRLRPLTFLDLAPHFSVGRFPTVAQQPVMVSMETFLRLSNGRYARLAELPMSACLIRTHRRAPHGDRSALVKELSGLLSAHGWKLWDLEVSSDALAKSNAVMSLIFSIATAIAIFLCLFSLVASMLTNIYEQAKEIAVLRAIGITRTEIIRIYTEEAFVLVLSSSILGIAIGFVMSATMIAQRILLTQLPVPIQFPFAILAYVVVGAMGCALIASWAPARALMKKSIAAIMKSVL